MILHLTSQLATPTQSTIPTSYLRWISMPLLLCGVGVASVHALGVLVESVYASKQIHYKYLNRWTYWPQLIKMKLVVEEQSPRLTLNVPSPIVQTDGTQIPPTAKLRNIHTTRNLRKLDHRPLQKKGTTWRLKPKSPFSVLKLPHAKAPITRRPRLPKPLVLLPPRQPNPSDSILPRALKSPNSKARRPNPYIASDSPPLGFLSPDSNPSDSSDNEDSASNGSEVLVVSDDSDSSLSEHPSSSGSLDSDSPMFDLFQRTELILQFDSQSRLVVCVGCSHPEVVFTRTMKQHLRRFHGANAARHFQLAQRFFDAHPRRTETFPTNLL